eukprot:GFKZ01012033.1.p1 GENE.GFKZ01012033.1~~GFKZ01012033.1.p1  ORF type:complete len:339 (-),score=34.61 GFKZ01012033.1:758-1774(-)
MDVKTHETDMENPKLTTQVPSTGPSQGTSSVQFVEAAALLTIWSVLVINEGAIRLLSANPGEGFSTEGEPPNSVTFAAGLAEVIFGMIGLFVGMAGFIFRWYNTSITLISLVAQTLLGYFVFIVFVFVVPGFQASGLTEGIAGLTVGQTKFLIALGVLTSFHFCLALQGGQFVFFCRLICSATGKDFLKQNSGHRMRAIFWNANLGLSGVWTLITGALVLSNVGGGRLEGPVPSPPNVVIIPAMTIITGVVLILFASLGIFVALSGLSMPWLYYLLGGLVYLLAYLNYGILQLGIATAEGRTFGGPVALHGGLVYMVVFLGPYFVYQASKERHVTSTA